MEPRIICITLAVDSIERSNLFYRDGLGLPIPDITEGADHIPIELQGNLYLVLTLRPEFAQFTALANQADAVRGSSECILSYFASSKEEVDTILKRVEAAGGTIPGQPKDQPWGYAGFFVDPDGHMWEIVWNPQAVARN